MAGSNGSGAGRPPIKEIRVGGVSAAIWDRNGQAAEGSAAQYSIRICKSYKDKRSNEFKTTEYYFPTDLPKLILAAEKAFEFISLKDTTVANADVQAKALCE